MTVLISIISFLVAIAILVGIHEFGHFWVARKLNIKIIRFAIGFGKPIWTYKSKDKDATEYVLAAIPMGGYVKMLDEREGEVKENEKHRAFNTQPVWKRFLVVLAGPMFNFFFAIFAFAAIQMIGVESVKPYLGSIQPGTVASEAGFQNRDLVTAISFWQPPHTTIINSVLADKPAAKAGLMAQDEVISVDGQAVSSTQFFSDYINSSAGKSIDIKVLRDNAEKTLSMTPMLTEIEGQQRVVIGVGLARKFDQEAVNELFFIEEAPFFQAIKLGVVETWDMSIMTLKVMGRLITGEASLKNISGPITIANYAGKSALIGFSAFLTLLAIVSLSLGVLNLLPIPMLDGGHLLYYIIELVKGSPVSERVEAVGMRIGMSLVGVLMVVALYNDIGRLIN